MKSIILDRKTGVSQETSANNFDIGSSKIVILNITKNNILSITQNDNQLVVQLKSGNPIIINDFYSSQNGNNENELVIDDPSEEELGYWWIEEPNSGLNWVQLDDLNPLMITNTSDGISPWVYAAGAGILAAGALAGGGGGGGGGHHHKGQQIATPVVSSNNAEGITGTGTPGWEIVLTKPDNTTEVTTVDENGKWSFNQNGNPLAHGETGKIIARDPQNNDKVSKEVETVADCQSPKTPVVETNNSNGISGTAEENSKIIVTNSKGEVVGEAMADDQGKWHIDSPNPLADGETGHFTATDAAGNTSDVTDDIADTVVPKAPEVKQNNAQGISGKAEVNSKVIVTNSKGKVVGEVMADDQGKWHIDSPNPLADGETGHFTATDKAGNTSKVTEHIADTVANAPKVDKNNASGISGTAEENSKVTITNSQNEVVAVVDVDAHGNWHLDSNPLSHGEEGHFTVIDEAGNISEETKHTADTVANAPKIDKNNASGISGTAEPNSIVTIINSQDEVVAVVEVDDEGKWHIEPNPLANNEEGRFTVTDKVGNISEETKHTADTVANAPKIDKNNASGISGTAEENSKVIITNSKDEVVAVVDVDAQGNWHLDSNPLANDEEGRFTVTDKAGNISEESKSTADTVAPGAPVVDKNNASGISGKAEANSKVIVTNSKGEIVGEAIADENNNWHIDSPNPLADGETGHFTATDAAGNISKVTDNIADTVAEAPTVEQNNAQGISGKAEANSKVIVTNSKGEIVGEAIADENENWHIDSPNPLADGETGHFTATDAAGNTSKVTDNIADTVVPEPPEVKQNNAQGISGKAEANSKVIVTNSKGEIVGEAIADENENWHIDSPNPLADGETGHFTATDAAGNTSKVTDNIADTVVPEPPEVKQNNAQGISGKAEANSKVIVTNSKGKVVGEVMADDQGNWHIDSPNPLAHGETGHFTAIDKAGNESLITEDIADKVALVPEVIINNAQGISGTAEENSKVTIINSQGEVVAEVDVDAKGNWHIDHNPLANNEEGQFFVTDKAGNTSKVTKHTADTEIPEVPKVDKNNASGISGTAEIGSTVTVTDSNGNIAQVVTGEDGSWKFDPNPLSHGAIGTITVTDTAGNISDNKDLGVIDTIVPNAPNVIHSNSKEIYGESEPNVLITIKDRKGNLITTTIADESGKWIINPNPIKTDRTVISVTATDEAGNESESGSAVTDLQPPDSPDVLVQNAYKLSGLGFPGEKIIVVDSAGATIASTVVDGSGNWEFIPNPLGNNPGRIVAMDDAHNVSVPFPIKGTSQYLEVISSLLRSDAEIDDINNHNDQQSISDKVDSDNTVESDNEPKVINVDNHSSSNQSEDLNSNELTSDDSQANDNVDIKDQFDLPNESQYLSLDKLLGTVNSDNGNNLDAIDSFTDRHILLINEDVDLTNLNDLLGSSKEAVSFYPENNQLQPESDLVEILDYIQGEQMNIVLETNFDNNELNHSHELEKVMTFKDTDDDILTQLANHQAVI